MLEAGADLSNRLNWDSVDLRCLMAQTVLDGTRRGLWLVQVDVSQRW
jgi:hypothetical protein